MASLATKGRIRKSIDEKDVEFVRVEMPDTNGCSRGVVLHAPYFLRKAYKDGFPEQLLFDLTSNGMEFPDLTFHDDISYHDGAVYAELDTFQILPWTDNTASVLTDFRLDRRNPNSPYIPISPRAICKTQLEKLNALGFRLFSSFEYEFYLLSRDTKKVIYEDENFRSIQTAMKSSPLINDIMRSMESIGISPEHYHPESGPSQHEVTMSPTFGIHSSDNAFRYKSLVKELAAQQGYMATFMSKPFREFSGSSGHFNHSLWDVNDKNVFYDADEQHGMSQIAQHWLAGLQYHSNTLFCFASPTPNCVERRNATGALAPSNNTWGFRRRTLAYLVKNSSCGEIYIENRLGASAANPYLLTAACIIAGMDGIERKLTLQGDPYDDEVGKTTVLPDYVKSLPESLTASVDCLVKNDIFVRELSPEFIKLFSEMKKKEDEMADKERSKETLYQWYMDIYGEYS